MIRLPNVRQGYHYPQFGTTGATTKLKDVEVCHYSKFFRSDLDWDKAIEWLSARHPDISRVVVYGCSDGSEPYSFALKLIGQLGVDGAQKYFPLKAYDKFEDAITYARDGVVLLRQKDIDKINKCLRSQGMSFDDVFELADQQKYPTKTLEYTRYNQQFKHYKAIGVLKDAVAFKRRDVLQGAEDSHKAKTLFMFRNSWSYLSQSNQASLAQKLKKSLPSGSIVLIGDYDLRNSYANENLREAGFHMVPKKLVKDTEYQLSHDTRAKHVGSTSFKPNMPTCGVFIQP